MIKEPKIYIIIPPSPWLIDDKSCYLLGSLWVTAYLESLNYNIDVIDLASLTEQEWAIPNNGDIYGITCLIPHDKTVRKITKIIRENNPEALIVLGGPHSTTLPEYLLNTTDANICVKGEGELTMADIVKYKIAFQNNRDIPYEQINGIFYRDTGVSGVYGMVKHTKPRELIKNLDDLPLPAFHKIDMASYSANVNHKELTLKGRNAMFSRGCCYQCSFCTSPFIWQNKLRFHSLNYAKEMIEILLYKYKAQGLYFVDDNITTPYKRCLDFAELMKPYNVSWRAFARTNDMDRKRLEAMKDAGCCELDIGVESFDDNILKINNKNVTGQQQIDALLLCKEIGINPKCCLIVGLPGETDDSIENTLRGIEKTKCMYSVGTFIPLPQSDIAANPEKYKYEIDESIGYNMYMSTKSDDGKGVIIQKRNKDRVAKWLDKVMQAIDDTSLVYNQARFKRKIERYDKDNKVCC
jgi:radical SAM superfamily enzyme YgiQ (UPF0313 family)